MGILPERVRQVECQAKGRLRKSSPRSALVRLAGLDGRGHRRGAAKSSTWCIQWPSREGHVHSDVDVVRASCDRLRPDGLGEPSPCASWPKSVRQAPLRLALDCRRAPGRSPSSRRFPSASAAARREAEPERDDDPLLLRQVRHGFTDEPVRFAVDQVVSGLRACGIDEILGGSAVAVFSDLVVERDFTHLTGAPGRSC